MLFLPQMIVMAVCLVVAVVVVVVVLSSLYLPTYCEDTPGLAYMHIPPHEMCSWRDARFIYVAPPHPHFLQRTVLALRCAALL